MIIQDKLNKNKFLLQTSDMPGDAEESAILS